MAAFCSPCSSWFVYLGKCLLLFHFFILGHSAAFQTVHQIAMPKFQKVWQLDQGGSKMVLYKLSFCNSLSLFLTAWKTEESPRPWLVSWRSQPCTNIIKSSWLRRNCDPYCLWRSKERFRGIFSVNSYNLEPWFFKFKARLQDAVPPRKIFELYLNELLIWLNSKPSEI